ncbi:hypothetical protein [Sulfitobacter guttiformis]|uniref:TetR family transcriptional regulator n=1 Tax=Sulfitobacter guttiformis TaxID=74349 RepID=A0A420DRU9_9RHOB|nr:hypothetical protein [Sulfitobacter guttiformis]KIN74299.1 hypothetical protein Z949_3497 [Sulfitobacter guttiformis KCTC 32187]RKE96900.1 hypothetical protein C8N30_1479 [Sulfitobacter guttiformis]
MGLTRGDLYKGFKDKKTYLRVLEYCESKAVADAFTLLVGQPGADDVERIVALFDSISIAALRGEHRGCFLRTAASGGRCRPDISGAVLLKMHGGFVRPLQHIRYYRKLKSRASRVFWFRSMPGCGC